MKHTILALPLFACFGIGVAAETPAPHAGADAVWRVAQKAEISLDQAVARIRQETGGRILSARAQVRKGRTVYRIKVLMPSGYVKSFHVDAVTGKTI